MSKVSVNISSCSRTIHLVVSLRLLLLSSMNLMTPSTYREVRAHSAAQAPKAVSVHIIMANGKDEVQLH